MFSPLKPKEWANDYQFFEINAIRYEKRFFKTYLKEIKQCAKQLSVYAKKIFLDNEDHSKGLMYRVNNLK